LDLGALKESILSYLCPNEDAIVGLLQQVVDVDTGTGTVAGLNEVARIFADQLRASGTLAEIVPGPQGDHVLAWHAGRGSQGSAGAQGRSLIIGHLDTVFPPGTVKERPFRVEGRRAFGPGVEDMKGGLVCAVFAMRALNELGLWPGHEIRLFFNSDEEVRSPTSSPVFAREGATADEVYVLEGARDDGSVVTARKGSARFLLTVHGVPAHSGSNHAAGRSAIRALASKVLALETLTDYQEGTTVNVGVIGGGLSFNTVPAKAWCDVDIRVPDPEAAARAVDAVRAVASAEHLPGTSTVLEGGITRPPMVRTPRIEQLFLRVRELAALLGRDLQESATGGGSDGCLTAASGAPTLDGLGPQGGGAHTPDEFVYLDSLVPCAALLAMSIATGPHVRRG
jgi:glutamate carboxypeptidase